MLLHPTLEKLESLRLHGMVKALKDQLSQTDISTFTFEERLSLLVDYEMTMRDDKRMQARIKKAKFKEQSCMENIDYRTQRGLDKSFVLQLANCQWIKEHRNILLVGPAGTGKTYLACALSHKACQEGYRSQYARMTRLLPALSIAKADGSYEKYMRDLSKVDVLILDDWGLLKFNDESRRDLLEILDDRHGKCSTIVTSQLPVSLWHENINDNTLADAILDRLIHNAYRIELRGESIRKLKSTE
jgi:DNA replication protein DnaC